MLSALGYNSGKDSNPQGGPEAHGATVDGAAHNG
jgi:hypothetical protein